jgi:hypothetical protein
VVQEGVLQMMLAMARSEEYLQQLVASEAIIAAASKKKDATLIVSQGLDILKSLYKSSNDHIKGGSRYLSPHNCLGQSNPVLRIQLVLDRTLVRI